MATRQHTASAKRGGSTIPQRAVNGKVRRGGPATVVHLPTTKRSPSKPQNGKVPPRRVPNSQVRSREYLTADEVERLMTAARSTGRHGHRDATLILIAYRHGLRVSELVALRWDQIDLKAGTVHVNRLKNGRDAVHPIRGPELRALRRLQRDYPASPYVFSTERRGPLTDSAVRKIVARAGRRAKLPFPVHPHQLRHACGYKLANDGHDTRAIQQFLGHANICHTVKYTELTPHRFNDFWRD
jgi:type 1 fimbriae regulatory protein FimE